MSEKLKFLEAWHLWRTKGKTFIGRNVTFDMVLAAAIAGIVEHTFGFFTEKLLGWWWNKKKDGQSK